MTKESFLQNPDAWSSHRPLLWEALEATKDSPHPVLEMGCGNGSTPYLRQYCQDNDRNLRSIDNNPDWALKFGAELISNQWDSGLWFYKQQYSVVLIDHAPGEKRHDALQLFSAFPIHFEIIVIHDSEIPGWNASDYKVRPLFKNFKYMIDDKPKEKGAPWTTALSNTVDVSKWEI